MRSQLSAAGESGITTIFILGYANKSLVHILK
uniref:Uncharacterized protein n=1 Tax=Anguilla anguilla TaxID=7936 RepID=A0A0E9SRF0_ANGAN